VEKVIVFLRGLVATIEAFIKTIDTGNQEEVFVKNYVGLNLRKNNSIQSAIILTIPVNSKIKSLESSEETNAKLGKPSGWLNVSYGDKVGFVSSFYLEEYKDNPKSGLEIGINLDLRNPQAQPEPELLNKLEWVRFVYNVSNGTGSQDFESAYNLYMPYIQKCKEQGLKILLVLNHQTFGEGRNYVWHQMDNSAWSNYSKVFSENVFNVVSRFNGSIDAVQVFNENDAPHGSPASISMTPTQYAIVLEGATVATRNATPLVKVITGGFNSGAENGSQYARQTLTKMARANYPDAISVHDYGRGRKLSLPYSPFGDIGETIEKQYAVLNKPVWLTEYGVLDRKNDKPEAIADFMKDTVDYIKEKYSNKVANFFWYAYSMSQHNGYSITDYNGKPIEPLYTKFMNL